MNIHDPKLDSQVPPLWRMAFRPFFLLASLYAVIAIALWLAQLHGLTLRPHGGGYLWHQHEMLFGMVQAVFVGFLLTAVATWTNQKPIFGRPLQGLALLWLLGRISQWLPIPVPFILLADISFSLYAAFLLAQPIVRVKQWRNLPLVGVLVGMALLNAASYWLGASIYLAAIVLLSIGVSIISGRVIPFFTARALGDEQPPKHPVFEHGLPLLLLGVVLAQLAGFSAISGYLLLLAAAGLALRALRWRSLATAKVPLLWSLHISYWAFVIGLLLVALHVLGYFPQRSIAIHCLTIGGMGLMILSMISRVSLGHSGRPLQLHYAVVVAFVLLIGAWLLRTLILWLLPSYYQLLVAISGVLWCLAFAIWSVIYWPILTTVRADGRFG